MSTQPENFKEVFPFYFMVFLQKRQTSPNLLLECAGSLHPDVDFSDSLLDFILRLQGLRPFVPNGIVELGELLPWNFLIYKGLGACREFLVFDQDSNEFIDVFFISYLKLVLLQILQFQPTTSLLYIVIYDLISEGKHSLATIVWGIFSIIVVRLSLGRIHTELLGHSFFVRLSCFTGNREDFLDL